MNAGRALTSKQSYLIGGGVEEVLVHAILEPEHHIVKRQESLFALQTAQREHTSDPCYVGLYNIREYAHKKANKTE